MKYFLIAVITLCTLISCSTIEDNSPALQGVNNEELFRAVDSRAIVGADGRLTIQGENNTGESLTFSFNIQNDTQVFLGGASNNQNIAVFTDQSGNQFSTAFDDATGEVNYTINGPESVSGDFRFVGFTPGMTDTVTFSRGFIFRVPFLVEDIVPVDLPEEEEAVSNMFTARINSAIFNPTVITNTVSAGVLTVSGQTSLLAIELVFPSDITPGDYELLEGTPIFGIYRNTMGDNISTSGTLQIISNDTENSVISGEFVFETPGGFVISDGAFTANY